MLNWGYIETGLVVVIALELFVCVTHLHTALEILLRWEQREMSKPVMTSDPNAQAVGTVYWQPKDKK